MAEATETALACIREEVERAFSSAPGAVLEAALSRIAPADECARAAAYATWDSIAHPLGGLGDFEDAVACIAAAQGSAEVAEFPRALAVFFSDNGVVAEGVSQSGQDVTRAVARNMCEGAASACRMAAFAGAEVVPVDVGMARGIEDARMVRANVRRGSGNIAHGSAMSRDGAVRAIEVGIAVACGLARAGVRLLGGDAVEKVSAKFANLPAGPHRATLMAEELSSRLTARLKSLAALEDTHDEIASLPVDEQLRLFGEVFDPQSDEEARTLALTYLEEKHADALRAMDAMEWLDIDRVAARLLGREGLTSVEWVYLKMALTGLGNPEARYVMIDEAQDYSQGQLAVLARYFRRAHFLLLGDPNQAIAPDTASFDEVREVFQAARGQVEECRLMTSYRSTPAITDLFARLLPAGEAMEVASVQREAPAPEIVVCEGTDEWKAALAEAVRVARDAGGLTAVIVPWKNDAKRLAKALDGVTAGSGQPPVGGDLGRPSAASDANAGQGVVVLGEGDSLPDEGIVVVPLKLAKGLEFDRVVIPDASARTFPESDIARRRLYTTISRATRHLTILSNGDLTELLG